MHMLIWKRESVEDSGPLGRGYAGLTGLGVAASTVYEFHRQSKAWPISYWCIVHCIGYGDHENYAWVRVGIRAHMHTYLINFLLNVLVPSWCGWKYLIYLKIILVLLNTILYPCQLNTFVLRCGTVWWLKALACSSHDVGFGTVPGFGDGHDNNPWVELAGWRAGGRLGL